MSGIEDDAEYQAAQAAAAEPTVPTEGQQRLRELGAVPALSDSVQGPRDKGTPAPDADGPGVEPQEPTGSENPEKIAPAAPDPSVEKRRAREARYREKHRPVYNERKKVDMKDRRRQAKLARMRAQLKAHPPKV